MALNPLDIRIEIAKRVADVCDKVYVYNEDGELEALRSITALDNDIVLEDVLDADIING